ncbi:MAG: biotin/lipoyl-containing protein [Longimicrobiaceae bacterium]
MKYLVTVAGRELEVDLSGERPAVDGAVVSAGLAPAHGPALQHLDLAGRSYTLLASRDDREGSWRIVHRGVPYRVVVVDERARAIREMVGEKAVEEKKSVTAPMPGLVVKVEVEEGEEVKRGQGVVVIEAMKMENELKSAADGVVAQVLVSDGETVEKGAVLVVLE